MKRKCFNHNQVTLHKSCNKKKIKHDAYKQSLPQNSSPTNTCTSEYLRSYKKSIVDRNHASEYT